ncbi:hypothetical protein FKP32DRAFT_352864 [Trametes sanguinea]|nr:hypothetical protein FKP32DRAFT_352864 [Trametes sanguinea]
MFQRSRVQLVRARTQSSLSNSRLGRPERGRVQIETAGRRPSRNLSPWTLDRGGLSPDVLRSYSTSRPELRVGCTGLGLGAAGGCEECSVPDADGGPPSVPAPASSPSLGPASGFLEMLEATPTCFAVVDQPGSLRCCSMHCGPLLRCHLARVAASTRTLTAHHLAIRRACLVFSAPCASRAPEPGEESSVCWRSGDVGKCRGRSLEGLVPFTRAAARVARRDLGEQGLALQGGHDVFDRPAVCADDSVGKVCKRWVRLDSDDDTAGKPKSEGLVEWMQYAVREMH